MNLIIDNQNVIPASGQSLLDMIRQLGLVTDRLSTQPLAASPITLSLLISRVKYSVLSLYDIMDKVSHLV